MFSRTLLLILRHKIFWDNFAFDSHIIPSLRNISDEIEWNRRNKPLYFYHFNQIQFYKNGTFSKWAETDLYFLIHQVFLRKLNLFRYWSNIYHNASWSTIFLDLFHVLFLKNKINELLFSSFLNQNHFTLLQSKNRLLPLHFVSLLTILLVYDEFCVVQYFHASILPKNDAWLDLSESISKDECIFTLWWCA